MTPQEFRQGIQQRSRGIHPALDTEQSRLALYGLGISGEAGEVADEVKKILFHDKPLDTTKLLSEIGDVLWYADRLCSWLGFELGDALQVNHDKLNARYPTGFSNANKKYDHKDGM